MDEKIINLLRQSMAASWAAGDDRFPERIIKSFRDDLPRFEKYYGAVPEEVIEEIIKEFIPDQAPEPVAETPDPIPEEDMGPRIKSVKKVPEPSEEAWTPTLAQVSWADQIIEEAFPEPEPKRTQAPGKRQAKKDFLEGAILLYLNRDSQARRKAYAVSDLHEQMECLHCLDERTVRRYVKDLYKAGKIKMWKKPVILTGGQKVYHFMYTSATNPNELFTFWVTK